MPILTIWLVVGAYVGLAAKSYTSELTLILPSAGSSSNFSLESIGQATTSTASPFATSTLSPKIVYKSIAESSRVRGLAAKHLGVPAESIDKPKIDLIDETSLMIFKVTGPSAVIAQQRAEAILEALQNQLDTLRRDEADRRSASIRLGLTDLEASLRIAQGRVLAFQKSGETVTLDQVKALSAQIDDLNRKIADAVAEKAQVDSQRASLSGVLNISSEAAAAALRLQGDPSFDTVSKQHAESLAVYSTNAKRWGPNHPQVIEARAKVVAAERLLISLGRQVASPEMRLTNLFLTTSRDRSELFRTIVELDARSKGLAGGIVAMKSSLTALQDKLEQRSESVARLEDLERDHRIAEAVFSSALARIDSGRQDIFASYPLAQVMSPPSLAETPTAPRPLYAALGGGGATVLLLLALVLAWLRTPFIQRHLRSA